MTLKQNPHTWAALCLAGLATVSQAALFDDDEARRAILDLRTETRQRSEALSQSLNQSLNQGLKAQAEELATLKRAFLDLQQQIENLKIDQSKLRGNNEQLARDLSELQIKHKDILQLLETRLSKFEPFKVSLDGLEFQVEPSEKKDYDAALAVFRTGDFAGSQNVWLSFLRRYPTSGYASSALFWLGNAQYATKDYKESILNFRKLLTIAPKHARAAEATLAVANCQVELKDLKAAKKTMEDLLQDFPGSEAAQTAKDRLTRMR